MNLLFFIDPLCVHDLKKINFFMKNPECAVYFLISEERMCNNSKAVLDDLTNKGAVFCGSVRNFSVVRFYITLRQFFMIRRIVAENRIDLFLIIYAEPNALWAVFKKLTRVPWSLYLYGSDILLAIPAFKKRRDWFSRLIFQLYKYSLKNFDSVVGTSFKQLQNAIDFGVNPERTQVIRTGIDVAGYCSGSKHRSLPFENNNKPFVFFPRNMKPLYNHELAMKAINLLEPEIRDQYLWVYVNKDTNRQDYFREIQALATSVNSSNFVFLPTLSQEQMFSCYSLATVAVMTPLSDGSPVSAMEAMLCHCPLIMPDIDYDQDLFNSETVSFYKQGNVESLAEVIKDLVLDKQKREGKAENARALVAELADTNKEMEKLLKILKNQIKSA